MWEYCVIGTAIKNPTSLPDAQDLLPSDFTGENQRVWSEILALYSRNALEMTALTTSLMEKHVFATETGLGSYLNEVLTYAGTSMKEYADHVLDASIKRSVQRSAALIASEAIRDEKTSQELIAFMEGELAKLRRTRGTELSMADIVATFLPRLDAARNGTLKPAWKPGLEAVKEIFPFAENSEFMIVAARPGDGKSSYLRYEAYRQARDKNGVLIINLENDPIEYARSFVALETGIDSMKMRTGELSDIEMEAVRKSATMLSNMPIYIEFAPTADQIVGKIKKYVAQGKISTVYVDYIQLVSNGIQKKVDDVSYTTRLLRLVSLELGIPVIAASQLNREIERRSADQGPQLADLRDSGSLEQDATSVMFIHQVWRDPTEQQMRIFPENVGTQGQVLPRLKAVPIQFNIMKNRNGEVGRSSFVKWHKSTGRFYTLERTTRL